MTRTPARPSYDAVVGLDPRDKTAPAYAFALVKLTYEISNGRAMLAAPAPLAFDFWSDETLEPRFPPGSDYWLDKEKTDVVIHGSAFAPGGRPTPSMVVSAQVGRVGKRIAVFGKRLVEWSHGSPRLGRPEPFTEIPLVYQNAYGGLDSRVSIPAAMKEAYMRAVALGMAFDHPGLYPRNPVGKGYLVVPDPVDGVELPNLEDPASLLTAERLITGKPELWYRQPLPWCFERTVALAFPRCQYLGMDAWFPAPEDATLPEVQRGFIPANLRSGLRTHPEWTSGYLQEASLGMTIAMPLAGQPVCLTGMHPDEPEIAFRLPAPPRIEITVEGERAAAPTLLSNLVISPTEKKLTAVYCAKTRGLRRVFIPGIHKHIPISVTVDGDAPIHYEAPVPLRDRLLAASPPAGSSGGQPLVA